MGELGSGWDGLDEMVMMRCYEMVVRYEIVSWMRTNGRERASFYGHEVSALVTRGIQEEYKSESFLLVVFLHESFLLVRSQNTVLI